MRWYLLVFSVLATILISCDKNTPTPNSNSLSKIVGDRIFTINSGNDQNGAPGQFLENKISITISDLKGNPVSQSLDLTLSDKSGILMYVSGTYSVDGKSEYHFGGTSDTVSFKWKLGCNELDQKITVKAINLCGVSNDSCINVDLFSISATADQSPIGWFTPCNENGYHAFNHSLVNDSRIALITDSKISYTDAPLNSLWGTINLPYSNTSGRYELLNSGQIYYGYNNQAFITKQDGTWQLGTLPFYNAENSSMDVTNNGQYFLITKYSHSVYMSEDGYKWTEYFDLLTLPDVTNKLPQAFTVNGNKVFIVLDGNTILELDTQLNSSTTYKFNNDSWPLTSLFSLSAKVLDNKLFLIDDSGSTYLYILDLDEKSITTVDLQYTQYKLAKSNDTIYLINSFSNIKKWNGVNFETISYPSPVENNFNSRYTYGFFNGAFVAIKNNGELYYYIE